MKKPSTTSNPTIAADWLLQGKLLAYPSESIWGIGCNAFDELAVTKLLDIKVRDINKGLIVLTDDADRLLPLLTLLPMACDVLLARLTTTLTSQAQTWLIPSPDNRLPDYLTGAHDSIAVRVTHHPLLQTLCQQLISPVNPYGFVVSTSCNPSKKPPATTFAQACAYFGENVSYLLGDTLGYDKPSCIKDIMTGRILRS